MAGAIHGNRQVSRRLTHVLRGAAAPLATAGRVVSLRERRWTALRRPCGRLPGRRKTLNVSCKWRATDRRRGAIHNAREVVQAASCVERSATRPHASDRVAQQDSRRAPPRSEFNRRNLLCSNAVRTVPLR